MSPRIRPTRLRYVYDDRDFSELSPENKAEVLRIQRITGQHLIQVAYFFRTHRNMRTYSECRPATPDITEVK